MARPLLSVILPIYGVEKYLEQSVEAVRNQSYEPLEIILVDDGSPDNCGPMCDAFAAEDPRIRVIHKANGGLSSARNAGLEIARGELIVFSDSDDWPERELYEKLYQAIVRMDADLAVSGYHKELLDEGQVKVIDKLFDFAGQPEDTWADQLIRKEYGQEHVFIKSLDNATMMAGATMFRREIIGDTRFVSERELFSEDRVFDLEILMKTSRAAIVNEALFFYRYNPRSLTQSFRPNYWSMRKTLIAKERQIVGARAATIPDAALRMDMLLLDSAMLAMRNQAHQDNPAPYRERIEAIREILSDPDLRELWTRVDLSQQPYCRMSRIGRIILRLMRAQRAGLLYRYQRLRLRMLRRAARKGGVNAA